MLDSLVYLDVECYVNYFLICFKSNKKTQLFELHNKSSLDVTRIRNIMEKYTTLGFNSNNYDLPMICYALTGATNKELKLLSDDLVNSNDSVTPWVKLQKYNIRVPYKWDHIDMVGGLSSVGKAPLNTVSLKMFGARINTKTLQDLPIEPDCIIEESDYNLLREYCINDVNITIELWEYIKDRTKLVIDIGNKYNLDLRSKSDAQIAEALVRKEFNITSFKNNIDFDKVYNYDPPKFINFKTKEFRGFYDLLLETEFKFSESKKIKASNKFPKIETRNGKITVGIGGLHSNEKHINVIPNDDEFLLDIDVSSYYPVIIINSGQYPELIGEKFTGWYKTKFEERIIAKKTGDKLTSDTIKIILNGSFGKFGSVYSCLFAPNLLIMTTLTGQLSLLMLIEDLILNGFDLVSANTDGITVKGNKSKKQELEDILRNWEEITKGELDRVEYKAIYNESVNSYIALHNKGIKKKGNFADACISKNPAASVCVEAVTQYLTNNVKIEKTILNNKDNITKFLVVRKVKGGGVWRGQYLGKTVRWYYSLDGDKITSKINNNQVANSIGAKPLMVIPDVVPKDIDFNMYIEKSYKMLDNLGVNI